MVKAMAKPEIMGPTQKEVNRMKLLRKNQSATFEGLTPSDLKAQRKLLADFKAKLKNLPPGLERMGIQSAISEMETRLKMAETLSPVADPAVAEKIKFLEKERDDLRAMQADMPNGPAQGAIAARISDLNIRIEMVKAMARAEIMGPAIGDSIEKLTKERDDLKNQLKNLPEGMDRVYIESSITELEIRIDMIRALSNPAPSNLQGFGILRMP
jgi:uncharacterized coiled-coil DUF342 family protein